VRRQNRSNCPKRFLRFFAVFISRKRCNFELCSVVAHNEGHQRDDRNHNRTTFRRQANRSLLQSLGSMHSEMETDRKRSHPPPPGKQGSLPQRRYSRLPGFVPSRRCGTKDWDILSPPGLTSTFQPAGTIPHRQTNQRQPASGSRVRVINPWWSGDAIVKRKVADWYVTQSRGVMIGSDLLRLIDWHPENLKKATEVRKSRTSAGYQMSDVEREANGGHPQADPELNKPWMRDSGMALLRMANFASTVRNTRKNTQGPAKSGRPKQIASAGHWLIDEDQQPKLAPEPSAEDKLTLQWWRELTFATTSRGSGSKRSPTRHEGVYITRKNEERSRLLNRSK
jgi:hypothetical protein